MIRIFDIILSGVILLLLSPFLIPLVVALRLTGEGEILFTQQRVGLGGKHFKLYKFATMLKDSQNMGTGTVTLKNDPRVLPMGRLLRSTKVNEVPQLLNIFLGDISIVGPRPQTQRCFDAFPERSQKEIVKVRPGLTGVGSIVFRGEEKLMLANTDPNRVYDQIIMPYKGLLEEWFVKNQSLLIYFKCILLTAVVVVIPKSEAVWHAFRGLPSPPEELWNHINWPDRDG